LRIPSSGNASWLLATPLAPNPGRSWQYGATVVLLVSLGEGCDCPCVIQLVGCRSCRLQDMVSPAVRDPAIACLGCSGACNFPACCVHTAVRLDSGQAVLVMAASSHAHVRDAGNNCATKSHDQHQAMFQLTPEQEHVLARFNVCPPSRGRVHLLQGSDTQDHGVAIGMAPATPLLHDR